MAQEGSPRGLSPAGPVTVRPGHLALQQSHSFSARRVVTLGKYFAVR